MATRAALVATLRDEECDPGSGRRTVALFDSIDGWATAVSTGLDTSAAAAAELALERGGGLVVPMDPTAGVQRLCEGAPSVTAPSVGPERVDEAGAAPEDASAQPTAVGPTADPTQGSTSPVVGRVLLVAQGRDRITVGLSGPTDDVTGRVAGGLFPGGSVFLEGTRLLVVDEPSTGDWQAARRAERQWAGKDKPPPDTIVAVDGARMELGNHVGTRWLAFRRRDGLEACAMVKTP